MAETEHKQRLLAPVNEDEDARVKSGSRIFELGKNENNLVMMPNKADFMDKDEAESVVSDSDFGGGSMNNSFGPSGVSGMSGISGHQRRNTLHLNKEHDVCIGKFPHARPVPGTRYFSQNGKALCKGIGVVIPFFNEPAHELETTMVSLWKSHQYLCQRSKLWRKRPLNVCIIQDGWYKASDSMKKYLKKIFSRKAETRLGYSPKKSAVSVHFSGAHHQRQGSSQQQHHSRQDSSGSAKGSNAFSAAFQAYEYDAQEDPKHWTELYPAFTKYNKNVDGPLTFVIEKSMENPYSYFSLKKYDFRGDIESGQELTSINIETQKKEDPPKLHLTLIVKIDNRRKHNSHEWFLGKSGFADAFDCDYFFCTDAYTMFQKNTLWELVNYLDKHPRCCGVTGRQRAMNRRQQRRKEVEWQFSIEYMLRLTQIYDFELAGSVFNPTYRLIGFLPVLPGPCGLYRSRDVLEDNVRDWYFEVVNSEPSQTGLVLGNLRIAEDRVLSYASVLKPKRYNLRLGYCPRALFYFEAEVDMDKFIYQRRRWINGTFAGYWYLIISSPSHLWMWNANFFRKIVVFFIITLNLVQMMALVVSPSFSFVIFKSSLSYLLSLVTTEYETVTIVCVLFSWAVWVFHVVIHNRHKYNGNIIKFLYFLSFAMTLCLFGSLFVIIVIKQENIVEELKLEGISSGMETALLVLFVFSFAAPFACAFLVDRGRLKGFLLLLKTVGPFFLSFYLMIPWFSSYAFARCWDLTWGNRPAETEFDAAKKRGPQAAMRLEAPSDFGEINEPTLTEQEITQARFKNMSTLIVLLLITVNLTIFFIPIYYTAILMGGMLAASAVFMFVSLCTLTVDIAWDMISWLFNSVCQCLCLCCCKWQDAGTEDLPVKDVRSVWDENDASDDGRIDDEEEIENKMKGLVM